MKLCVFASGSGSNLQALIDAQYSQKLCAEVAAVVSNNESAYALERARCAGISAYHIASQNFERREDFLTSLCRVFDEHNIELIVLAGYLKKLPPEIVQKFANRILNVHPSLLPSFGGKGMHGLAVHRAVLNAGCKVSGATVHIVDERYDTGIIVLQKCVAVLDDDTPETLAARVLTVEHELLPRAVRMFAHDEITICNGRSVYTCL